MTSDPPGYREHTPHAALRRYVECYWSVRGGDPPVSDPPRRTGDGCAPPVVDHVLPDGCMDAIFGLDGPDRPGSGLSPGDSLAVGTLTEVLPVPRPPRSHIWGVRFRPGAGAAFLGVQAGELTDLRVPLSDVWRHSADETCAQLEEVDRDTARTEILDAVLRRTLSTVETRIDHGTLTACEVISRSAGATRIDRIAHEAGLGRRQLERRFASHVGIPPKVACRVARLRKSVHLLRRRVPRHLTLAEVALAAGYADQPHFTREFRALAGTTPAAYRDRG